MTEFQYPGTPEARKAGMARLRAQMLAAHERQLAGGDPNAKRKGKTGDAARSFHADMIGVIKSAQQKYGEA